METLGSNEPVIRLLRLAASLREVLHAYSVAVKRDREKAVKFQAELAAFQNVLADLVEGNTLPAACISSVVSCHEELEPMLATLQNRLNRAKVNPSEAPQSLYWPFLEVDDGMYMFIIARHKASISVSLSRDYQQLVIDSSDINARVSKIYIQFTDSSILYWLDPPDVASYLDSALSRRTVASTGDWLFDTEQYGLWLGTAGSVLLVSGSSGAGKTILSSYIVCRLSACVNRNDRAALAYFFFDSSNPQDTNPISMLRSLIWQTAPSCEAVKQILEACHTRILSEKQRTNPVDAFLYTLHSMLCIAGEVYFIVDGVDEYADQKQLSQILERIIAWQLPNLHIILTARDFRKLDIAFSPSKTCLLSLEKDMMTRDIDQHIKYVLQNDNRLNQWPTFLKKRLGQLSSKTSGVFQLAQHHIDILSQCLTHSSISKSLDELPPTLYGVYETILWKIPVDHKEPARRLLTWLSCAMRPLTLEELTDVAALSHNPPTFKSEERIMSLDAARHCSGLIIMERSMTHPIKALRKGNRGAYSTIAPGEPTTPIITARIAHSSVHDYLLSDDILQSNASYFSLRREGNDASHLSVAQMCTAYIDHAQKQGEHNVMKLIERMPLCPYAAEFWHRHAKLGCEVRADIVQGKDFSGFLERLSFSLALKLSSPEIWLSGYTSAGAINEPIPTLYFASLFGLMDTVKGLLSRGAEVNDNGGALGSPLHAAVFGSHVDLAACLIKSGADCNARSKKVGSVLHLAAARNNLEIVNLLLHSGADPTIEHAQVFGSAIVAALLNKNTESVRAILKNTQKLGAQEKIALLMACYLGHTEVVRMMLDMGLTANNHDELGSPLSATLMPVGQISSEREAIIEILLDHGADVDPSFRDQVCSLTEADAMSGDLSTIESLVKSILMKSVDPRDELNSIRYHGFIPPGSMRWNHEPVSTYGSYVTSLEVLEHCCAARISKDQQTFSGHELAYGVVHISDNIKMSSLDRKLYEINSNKRMSLLRDRLFDKPLEAACRSQNLNIVRMLLGKGALVAPCSPDLLHLAVPHSGILSVLVDSGVKVSQSSSTAFAKAARYGDMTLVRWLVDHGAIIDASPPEKILRRTRKDVHFINSKVTVDYAVKDVYCIGDATALTQACQKGYTEIVRYLLDAGASISIASRQWGSNLHATAMLPDAEKRLLITKLLLEKGADPNVFHDELGLPLHVAIQMNDVELAYALIEAGTNLETQSHVLEPSNPQERRDQNSGFEHEGFLVDSDDAYLLPLHLSIFRRRKEMTAMLLQQGASISAAGLDGSNALGFLLSLGWRRDFGREAWADKDEISGFVNILIAHGCRLDSSCGGPYEHPLQAAVGFRSTNILKHLLQNGALVNVRGGRYGSAFSAASNLAWSEGIELLLDAGADPQPSLMSGSSQDRTHAGDGDIGRSPLASAAKAGFTGIVKTLLSVGATDSVRRHGQSQAVQEAIDGMHVEIVQMLLDAGHEVDPTEADAMTSIQRCLNKYNRANGEQRLAMIRMLLANGASAVNYDRRHPAPLTSAAALNLEPVVEILLKHGAESPVKQYDVCCPICSAIRARADESLIERLITHGCDIDHYSTYATSQSLHGTTTSHWVETIAPLHSAAFVNNSDILRRLLMAGANPRRNGPKSHSVAHTAIENGRQRDVSDADTLALLKVLREHGANMSLVSKLHGTPLNLAISSLKVESMRYLLCQTRSKLSTSDLESLKSNAVGRLQKLENWLQSSLSRSNQALNPEHAKNIERTETSIHKISQIIEALDGELTPPKNWFKL